MSAPNMPLRLWLATLMAFAASRLAPRMMRPVFVCYCDFLSAFPREVEAGRTFGVMVTAWSQTPENLPIANEMQTRALTAVAEMRRKLAALPEAEP